MGGEFPTHEVERNSNLRRAFCQTRRTLLVYFHQEVP